MRPLVFPVFAGVLQQVSLAVERDDLFGKVLWCCETTGPSLPDVCSPVIPVFPNARPTGSFSRVCLIDSWSKEFSLINCLEMNLISKGFFFFNFF